MDTITSLQKQDSSMRGAEYIDQHPCNDVCPAAVIGEKHPLWQKLRPKDPDNKEDLRRIGHYLSRILLHPGV